MFSRMKYGLDDVSWWFVTLLSLSSSDWCRKPSESKVQELLGLEAAALRLIFRDFRLKELLDKVRQTSVLLLS